MVLDTILEILVNLFGLLIVFGFMSLMYLTREHYSGLWHILLELILLVLIFIDISIRLTILNEFL